MKVKVKIKTLALSLLKTELFCMFLKSNQESKGSTFSHPRSSKPHEYLLAKQRINAHTNVFIANSQKIELENVFILQKKSFQMILEFLPFQALTGQKNHFWLNLAGLGTKNTVMCIYSLLCYRYIQDVWTLFFMDMQSVWTPDQTSKTYKTVRFSTCSMSIKVLIFQQKCHEIGAQ